MIPVEVAVDHVAHRLGSHLFLDLRDQLGGCGRFGMAVDDEDIIRLDEDRGVGVYERLRAGDGEIDAVGYFFNFEELGGGSGGLCSSGGCSEERRLENRGSGE